MVSEIWVGNRNVDFRWHGGNGVVLPVEWAVQKQRQILPGIYRMAAKSVRHIPLWCVSIILLYADYHKVDDYIKGTIPVANHFLDHFNYGSKCFSVLEVLVPHIATKSGIFFSLNRGSSIPRKRRTITRGKGTVKSGSRQGDGYRFSFVSSWNCFVPHVLDMINRFGLVYGKDALCGNHVSLHKCRVGDTRWARSTGEEQPRQHSIHHAFHHWRDFPSANRLPSVWPCLLKTSAFLVDVM